jgi:hypothetical protein
MAHWRKPNPSALYLRYHLVRWILAFSVIAGIFGLLSVRGYL